MAFSVLNSDGVHMTKEDHDFYLDSDCSVGEHLITRVNLHDTVVENANYFASGEAESFLSLVRTRAKDRISFLLAKCCYDKGSTNIFMSG